MHPKMLPCWSRPASPVRYPDLTVIKITLDYGHRWHLDFSRQEDGQRWYASDTEKCSPIQWPWVEGFEPDFADWQAIGFGVTLEMRDHVAEIRPASDETMALHAFVRKTMFDIAMKKAGGGEHEPGNA